MSTVAMKRTVSVPPVRKSVRVRTTPAHAFEVFTSGMIRWWRKGHSINKSPFKDIVLEPRAGGRWFERGEDGSECQWGKVLAWEPPARLVLAWQISPQWAYDPNLMTEVEVRFTASGEHTEVVLEHRLDGFGPAAADMFKTFDGDTAWQGTLDAFAKAVAP